jgi:general stress protein 26
MKTTEELYDFLADNQLMVVSTVTDTGRPNAAIVGFGQTKDLQILFGTDNSSRKYRNLQKDPHVAITIGGTTPETIQLEGIARELTEDELDLVRENYWKKNPFAKKHHENPGQRYFIVTPKWLRYTDLRSEPWDITERSF